jgi:hypothetical protein
MTRRLPAVKRKHLYFLVLREKTGNLGAGKGL